MEFDGKFPWNSVWYWDVEFHENISMEFYGVPQKLSDMEFQGILRNIIYGIIWSSTKAQLHGIPWKTSL